MQKKSNRELIPFGREVKKRLIDLGKTQRWLAEEIGTSETYLNQILHGERKGTKYTGKIKNILNFNLGIEGQIAS